MNNKELIEENERLTKALAEAIKSRDAFMKSAEEFSEVSFKQTMWINEAVVLIESQTKTIAYNKILLNNCKKYLEQTTMNDSKLWENLSKN